MQPMQGKARHGAARAFAHDIAGTHTYTHVWTCRGMDFGFEEVGTRGDTCPWLRRPSLLNTRPCPDAVSRTIEQYVGHTLMSRQSTAAARLLYWFARSARPEHSQPLTGQPQNRDGEFVKPERSAQLSQSKNTGRPAISERASEPSAGQARSTRRGLFPCAPLSLSPSSGSQAPRKSRHACPSGTERLACRT